mmetsp:Transcript_41171/g.118418  ORF Transcript_41171/g.118418 Transcript_41171/m.118418 type:complete len:233 (-) Transcript_41171:1041-1739(-)
MVNGALVGARPAMLGGDIQGGEARHWGVPRAGVVQLVLVVCRDALLRPRLVRRNRRADDRHDTLLPHPQLDEHVVGVRGHVVRAYPADHRDHGCVLQEGRPLLRASDLGDSMVLCEVDGHAGAAPRSARRRGRADHQLLRAAELGEHGVGVREAAVEERPLDVRHLRRGAAQASACDPEGAFEHGLGLREARHLGPAAHEQDQRGRRRLHRGLRCADLREHGLGIRDARARG